MGMRHVAVSALAFSFSVHLGCSEETEGTNDGPGETDGSSGGAEASAESEGADAGPDSGGSGGGTTTGTSTGGGTEDSGTSDPPPPVDEPLLDRLEVFEVSVPEGVEHGANNWRIWGTAPLGVAPVFTVPLENCGTLVGFTTSAGTRTARVAVLDAEQSTLDMLELGSGLQLRGLASEGEGRFAALLWDDAQDRIWVKRYDLAGTELSSTELINSDNTPTDFGIGDSRLEYGGGRYGAYYHVHSNSGHEGDTLKWVDVANTEPSTGWGWGCSHSMSNLLRWHAGADRFLPVCVTDCFPGTSGDFGTNSIGGIYLDHNKRKVLDVAAGCNGSVAGEVGSAALTPEGWSLVFNAHQAPATHGQSSYDPSSMNQDIGVSFIGSDLQAGPVVWLTDTSDIDEADASVARWEPAGDSTEQYVVGWYDQTTWMLARMDSTGAFLEGPVDVGATAMWGRRDDPFRRHFDGDVLWAWFDAPGSTTLQVARLDSGGSFECAQ